MTIEVGRRVRIKKGADGELWVGAVGKEGTVSRESEHPNYDWTVLLDGHSTEDNFYADELEVIA